MVRGYNPTKARQAAIELDQEARAVAVDAVDDLYYQLPPECLAAFEEAKRMALVRREAELRGNERTCPKMGMTFVKVVPVSAFDLDPLCSW